MARPRRAQSSTPETKKLSKEQIVYLGGIYDATIGLKSVNTIGAAAISKSADWPEYMAKTYGGEAREFTSSSSKVFWGWFVSLQQRLDILDALEAQGATQTPALERDAIRAKLTKAVSRGASK